MQERMCNICGVALQSANPAAAGYVPSRVLLGTSQSVCQRCHRTRMAPVLAGRNQEVASGGVRRVLEKADLSLLVIDITDFEGTFSKRLLRHCGRRLMIVANKIDLLPGRTSRSEVLDWVTRRLADAHITTQGVFLVSVQKGIGTAALWDEVKKEVNGRGTVTVVGVEGVGKTALVDSWIEYNKTQDVKKKNVRRKSKRSSNEAKVGTVDAASHLTENSAVTLEQASHPESNVEQESTSAIQTEGALTHWKDIAFAPITIIEQPPLFDLVSIPEPEPGPEPVVYTETQPELVVEKGTASETAVEPETASEPVAEQETASESVAEQDATLTSQMKTSAPMSIADDDDASNSGSTDEAAVKAVSPRPKRRRRTYPARRRSQKPGKAAVPPNTDSPNVNVNDTPASVAVPVSSPEVTNPTPPAADSNASSQQQMNAQSEQKNRVKPKRSRRRKPKKATEKTAESVVAQPTPAPDAPTVIAEVAPKPDTPPKGKPKKKAKRATKTAQTVTEVLAVEVKDKQSEGTGPKPKSNRRRPRRRDVPKPLVEQVPQLEVAITADATKQPKADSEPEHAADGPVQIDSAPGGEPVAAKSKPQPKTPIAPKSEAIETKVIDTLSVPARGRLRDSLCTQCTQNLTIQKPLRSRVLRLKVGQSAVLSGLVALSVKAITGGNSTASLMVFMPQSVTVQQVSGEAIDEFLRRESQPWRMEVCDKCTEHLLKGGWEETEMTVDEQYDLALHGMGWIAARKCSVTLRVLLPAGMLASMRPRLIGSKA
jgi:hypothetical protein